MATFAFDTLEAQQSLTDAGVEDKHATAFVALASKSVSENVATKEDITDLKVDLKTDIAELKMDIANLRADLKTDIAGLKTAIVVLRADLKTDIAELRADRKRTSPS